MAGFSETKPVRREQGNIFKILRQKETSELSLKISFRNKGKLTKFQLCSS